MAKKVKILAFMAVLVAVALTIYAKSFPDVERICEHKRTETYLLNYVSKHNLEQVVREHNSKFPVNGKTVHRIYLLHPIFRIPDPIFGDELDYKQNDCEPIDNMDIFAEVRYDLDKNGKTHVWYNFLE